MKTTRKDYYAGGKRGSEGGVPIWRPKWWGELGNDKEFREATKPRTAFKAAYYEGGHRMTIDGIPVRVAAYVKDWAPWMKRAICSGIENAKEARETERQIAILFPSYVPSWDEGKASCLACRSVYTADSHGHPGHCWECKRQAWAQEREAA